MRLLGMAAGGEKDERQQQDQDHDDPDEADRVGTAALGRPVEQSSTAPFVVPHPIRVLCG